MNSSAIRPFGEEWQKPKMTVVVFKSDAEPSRHDRRLARAIYCIFGALYAVVLTVFAGAHLAGSAPTIVDSAPAGLAAEYSTTRRG